MREQYSEKDNLGCCSKSLKYERFFVIVAFCSWIGCTFWKVCNHFPWLDETHAWNIAKFLSVPEIFNLMEHEGHMFVWYMLLKPFAISNFYFPLSMNIINWLFLALGLLIFVKYTDFPCMTKCVTLFSIPFFCVYPVYARCYTVGIFLLFLLSVLFKERMKHPFLYPILIFLCANTSVMAFFGALAFGLIYVCDCLNLVIRNIKIRQDGKFVNKFYLLQNVEGNSLYKKFLWFPLVMLIITSVVLYLQVGHVVRPSWDLDYLKSFYGFKSFLSKSYFYNDMWISKPLIPNLLISGSIVSLFVLARKSIYAILFFIVSLGGISMIFTWGYNSHDYHFFFIYVYIICAYMILNSDVKNLSYIAKTVFLTMFTLLMIYTTNFAYKSHFVSVGENNIKQDAIRLKLTSDSVKGGLVFYSGLWIAELYIPYEPDLVFKDLEGEDLFTYKNYAAMYLPGSGINDVVLFSKSPFIEKSLFVTGQVFNKQRWRYMFDRSGVYSLKYIDRLENSEVWRIIKHDS